MDKVFFLKKKDFSKFSNELNKILKDFYLPNKEVITKFHFGEPGNELAFIPKDIFPIIEVLKSYQLDPVLFDTLVAYNSPRNNIKGHEKVVKQKGFDKISKFLIGKSYTKVQTKDFIAEVANELIQAENVLVISHVKGHSCSGFGGAIKNLGMGGVSKKTKNLEHSFSRPKLVGECMGCGICAEVCPFKAIEILNGKVKIDYTKCAGCSICQEKCPYDCLKPEKLNFDDLLAQGASAVIKNLPKNTFYINYLIKIARNCDCDQHSGGRILDDIGVLFSSNPIAIDKASIDLVDQKQAGLFEKVHNKDPMEHVKLAGKYTKLGSDYRLIEL